MDKSSARESILRKLKSHDDASIEEKSSLIREKLVSTDEFKKAGYVFIYLSGAAEVSTMDIVSAALDSGKNVYSPMIVNGNIETGIIENIPSLRPGKYGILEPKEAVAKNEFDIIIVPGVAFGMDGSRAGRGGGHFDRFLTKTKGKRIALAFDFQIVDKIDTETHDVRMDLIITEKRTIHIKKNWL
ncbi:MAG: 5-formyltetrahydrofolate cyclo-ligase [Candidatus Aenigmarchaeota archaeon]|nr:5-formyltetrahydrofolate cyclo-ligase [Candidatus Aenigmarchaeota archaeon]